MEVRKFLEAADIPYEPEINITIVSTTGIANFDGSIPFAVVDTSTSTMLMNHFSFLFHRKKEKKL